MQDLQWKWARAVSYRHWAEMPRRHRWVFILGCNNSGTTILYYLLGRHPDVTALSQVYEGHSLTRALPHPRQVGAGRIWTERLDVFRWTEATNHIDIPRLVFDWLTQLKESPRRFILEKSPPNTLRSRWLQQVFSDSSLIGIVRNGYAVAEGIRRRTGRPIERCARHWDTANRIMLEDAPFLRRFTLIRYEELTRDPAAVLKGIADFLGIDFAPFQSLIDSEWRVHNVEAAPSRIRNFNDRSLSRLTPSEIEVVMREARGMLEHFGYTPPSR